MKETISRYLDDDDLWLIKESEWDESLQNVRESQFTIGNGYLGSRGALEELPSGCMSGTCIAGVFDSAMARSADIVNFPNPFVFKCSIDGEKLCVGAMNAAKHTTQELVYLPASHRL